MRELSHEVSQILGQPFRLPGDIAFLPRDVRGDTALALAFMRPRAVMQRLDAAVGPDGWTWEVEIVDHGAREGKMTLKVKGRLTVCGITREDFGEALNEDEPAKAAASDALKRCAVLFGVGRYLYYLPAQRTPYDSGGRRWKQAPTLTAEVIRRACDACGIIIQGEVVSLATAAMRDEDDPGDVPAAAGTHPVYGDGGQVAGQAGPITNNPPPPTQVPAIQAPTEDSPFSDTPVPAAQPAATGPKPNGSRKPFAATGGAGTVSPPAAQPAPAAPAAAPQQSTSEQITQRREHAEKLAEAVDTKLLKCSEQDCPRAITRKQYAVSINQWGRPLCPQHAANKPTVPPEQAPLPPIPGTAAAQPAPAAAPAAPVRPAAPAPAASTPETDEARKRFYRILHAVGFQQANGAQTQAFLTQANGIDLTATAKSPKITLDQWRRGIQALEQCEFDLREFYTPKDDLTNEIYTLAFGLWGVVADEGLTPSWGGLCKAARQIGQVQDGAVQAGTELPPVEAWRILASADIQSLAGHFQAPQG